MYRKSVQDAMDNNSSNSVYRNTIEASQFLTRLVKIPVVNSAINVASDIYGKAKNSGGLVGKTLGVAERTCFAAAGQVLPFAQKLTPLAVQPLTRVDDFANKGLEKLENKVPAINKMPLEFVSDTKELISSKMNPAVERINSVSETLLSTRLFQLSFDIFDHFLNSASTVVDHVLPPNAAEKVGMGQNGFSPDSKTPEEKTARFGYLFRKALYLAANTTRRLLGLAQSRVDSAVSATDTVVTSARKSLNNILPNAAQNGDSNHKERSKNKNKNKSQ